MSTQNTQGHDMENIITTKASTPVKWMVIVMILIIIIATVMYIYTKTTYKDTRCNIIKDVYTDMGKVSSINIEDPNYKGFLLRDYYVKTAYNCCAQDFKYICRCMWVEKCNKTRCKSFRFCHIFG